MKDPQWAKEWGGMVYEMIGDIANANRDGSSYNRNSETKYPFLRILTYMKDIHGHRELPTMNLMKMVKW